MRIALALLALTACGNSAPPATADAPVNPHLVVACGAEWGAPNATCEAACEHNTDAGEVGAACRASLYDPGWPDPIPVDCAGTFSFQGARGCCELTTGTTHVFAACD